MTLPLEELVRLIRLHILPARMVKIRHHGILSTRNRKKDIALARRLPDDPPLPIGKAPKESLKIGLSEGDIPPQPLCPFCKQAALSLVAEYAKGKTPPPWNTS